MSWLEFTAKIIDSLAWPASILFVLFIIRGELPVIARSLKKLKFKEVPIKAIYTDYSLAKGQSLTNSMNVFGKLTLLLFR